jgi:hypothetical protein
MVCRQKYLFAAVQEPCPLAKKLIRDLPFAWIFWRTPDNKHGLSIVAEVADIVTQLVFVA